MRAKQYARQLGYSAKEGRLVLNGRLVRAGEKLDVLIPARFGGRWKRVEVVFGRYGWALQGETEGLQPVGLWAKEVKS